MSSAVTGAAIILSRREAQVIGGLVQQIVAGDAVESFVDEVRPGLPCVGRAPELVLPSLRRVRGADRV